MTPFDDPPPHPPQPDPLAPLEESGSAAPVAAKQNAGEPRVVEPGRIEPVAATLDGDPITYAATLPPAGSYSQNLAIPEDLRISWYWPHFILFLFFAGASFVVVQTALFFYYGPRQPMPRAELEKYLLNKPQFIFGTNILWYAAVFFFLYVTLSVLRDAPFWSSLGWTKLKARVSGSWGSPSAFFFSGCALAIFVGLASSRVHTKENMPIQELFKNRENAVLLMCMAVLIAPLVEETVFRGYLYPLFARMAYTFARRLGKESAEAVRTGTRISILLTGVLFGLMHGSQLGWNWGVVGLLILVGVIFTFVRARTGTVLASFLLHLGYNSMIAVTTVIGTHGFTRIPTSP
jgi:membrane protease YdiL (CAAX protease family)